MRRPRALLLAATVLSAACDSGSGGTSPYQTFNPGTAPAELRRGEMLFNTYCISCHGRYGRGDGLGPRLLDTLYVTERMPDTAIFAAVELGVNQKYWHYGAMPRVQRLGRPDIAEIVPYIRWFQARAGLGDSTRASGGR